MESLGIVVDDLLLLVAVLAVYAVFGRAMSRLWISAAFFFALVGTVVGPSGLAWFESRVGSASVEELAGIALATVLFGDATRVQLNVLRVNLAAPTRLLTIGLLGTVALGTLAAHLLLGGITWPIALVIGVILAPTDAALGAPVVENPAVPSRVRSALFVESGLNDGLAVPLLVVALALAELEASGDSVLHVLFMKLVVSAVVGAALSLVAHLSMRVARRLGGVDDMWASVVPLLTAAACYLLAEFVGGSGFIAAFVGGVTMGAVARGADADQGVEVDEAISSLLQGATWFLFGALAVGPMLLGGLLQWTWVLYAVLSLTVIRMVPVALALLGLHWSRASVLFAGWFGPRGLASVVFLLLILGLGPRDSDAVAIAGVATITVVLSIVLHGFTAQPLARRFGAYEAARSTSA